MAVHQLPCFTYDAVHCDRVQFAKLGAPNFEHPMLREKTRILVSFLYNECIDSY